MSREEDALTTEYRQKACLLAAKASAGALVGDDNCAELLASRQVAQHMLNYHPGSVSVSAFLEMNPELSQEEDITNDTILPCCHSCGEALQPGIGATTLRLTSTKALTKTQRRRAMRKQQRIKKQSQSKHKLWEFCNENENASSCRNHLVLQCGSCRFENRVAVKLSKRPLKKADKKRPAAKPKPFVSSKPKKTNQQELGDDFISLESNSVKNNPSGTTSSRPARTLLDQGKKKKKKSDKLMNFLSSLNN
jgi:hypothetical protein